MEYLETKDGIAFVVDGEIKKLEDGDHINLFLNGKPAGEYLPVIGFGNGRVYINAGEYQAIVALEESSADFLDADLPVVESASVVEGDYHIEYVVLNLTGNDFLPMWPKDK